jgi:hypothetical protein
VVLAFQPEERFDSSGKSFDEKSQFEHMINYMENLLHGGQTAFSLQSDLELSLPEDAPLLPPCPG